MKHFCPICQMEMKPTASEGLFGCPMERFVTFPGIIMPISYWDAGILFGPDNILYWQMYEIPPYRIRIYDRYPNSGTKTIISKLIVSPFNYIREWDYKDIFTINAAIDLPWHDTKQVIEKIQLYATFS